MNKYHKHIKNAVEDIIDIDVGVLNDDVLLIRTEWICSKLPSRKVIKKTMNKTETMGKKTKIIRDRKH